MYIICKYFLQSRHGHRLKQLKIFKTSPQNRHVAHTWTRVTLVTVDPAN